MHKQKKTPNNVDPSESSSSISLRLQSSQKNAEEKKVLICPPAPRKASKEKKADLDLSSVKRNLCDEF